jgi:transposase InsO family protein
MVVDRLGHLCKVSTTTIGKVRHLYSLGSLLEQDSTEKPLALVEMAKHGSFLQQENPNLQLQRQGNQSSNTDFPSSQPPWAPCQICGKTSHSALDCFHRMDYAYQGRHPPPQLAAMVAQTNSTFEEKPWFADSGANAHITRDLENLSIQPQPFQGPESVAVGNGASLTIEHTGSTIFHSPSIPFYLKHVLHCPTATANLLSIQKFCQDNNCYFVLTSSHYFVKDLRTHALLLEGKSENGLYPLKLQRTSSKNAPVFSVFLGIKASTLMWHSRLGHPSFSTVNNVIKAHSLPLLNNDINKEHFCDFCQLGKSKQLPFTASTRSTTSVLDLIHTDLWTSLVPSISGCKYYIIFVDDFTRYTWLYPLHFKSDAYHCFVKFKMLVENQFSCKIKQLQSDGGGEYTSNLFLSFLSNNGIQHCKSCPHTSQQNGLAKRKLRHILETGLTLLAHSGLSNRYWVDAFLTSVFIINRLPTPVLDHMSPYERLFHKSPDYSLLCVFGCKCFPLLRPYTAHKLEFRSKACVFLGYSHAGYCCLDPVMNRVYLSRNVTFDEQSFPAKDHAHLQLPSKINAASDGPFLVQVGSPISSTLSLPTYTPHATVAPSISTNSVSDPHNITSPPIAAPDSALPIDPAPDPGPLTVSSPVADSPLPTLAPAPLEPAIHPVCLDNPTAVPSPTISATPEALDSAALEAFSPTAPIASSLHPMTTRSKTGSLRPNSFPDFQLYSATKHPLPIALHSVLTEVEPTCFTKAATDTRWRAAMAAEFEALISNKTWTLCPRPSQQHVTRNHWVYKIKQRADGSIDHFKGRLVAKGFEQQSGVDYTETFSPVIKPSTICIILALAVHFDWPIKQLDVSNAFLHGTLLEEVYMEQPQGFVDATRPDFVCRLHKSIYGLK